MRIKPKKRLGQNFLVDKNIRNKIIDSCGLKSSDIVLEIGSGRGELTGLLSRLAGKVCAIEIDPPLCDILKEEFSGAGNVEIIMQDVLKFDIDRHFSGTGKQIKVVGNIPYYISSPIIERLFKFKDKISDIFLTVQKEFAGRVVARAGSSDYGSLSVFVQYHSEPEIIFNIGKGCFFPAPKVDSSFLHLSPRRSFIIPPRDEAYFFKIVRSSFGKRRKTLRSSLKGVLPQEKLDIFFKTHRISVNARPQELNLQEFIDLANT